MSYSREVQTDHDHLYPPSCSIHGQVANPAPFNDAPQWEQPPPPRANPQAVPSLAEYLWNNPQSKHAPAYMIYVINFVESVTSVDRCSCQSQNLKLSESVWTFKVSIYPLHVQLRDLKGGIINYQGVGNH